MSNIPWTIDEDNIDMPDAFNPTFELDGDAHHEWVLKTKAAWEAAE